MLDGHIVKRKRHRLLDPTVSWIRDGLEGKARIEGRATIVIDEIVRCS
jgi:hypothetical protein